MQAKTRPIRIRFDKFTSCGMIWIGFDPLSYAAKKPCAARENSIRHTGETEFMQSDTAFPCIGFFIPAAAREHGGSFYNICILIRFSEYRKILTPVPLFVVFSRLSLGKPQHFVIHYE